MIPPAPPVRAYGRFYEKQPPSFDEAKICINDFFHFAYCQSRGAPSRGVEGQRPPRRRQKEFKKQRALKKTVNKIKKGGAFAPPFLASHCFNQMEASRRHFLRNPRWIFCAVPALRAYHCKPVQLGGICCLLRSRRICVERLLRHIWFLPRSL